MGSAAVAAARAVGYVNAGTVEFIADETRRVLLHGDEHPAAGRAPGDRDDHRPRPGRVAAARRLRGSRCRWRRSSLPSTATRSRRASTRRTRRAISCPPPAASSTCACPTSSAHVRIDSGVREGDEIGVYYDPMIAKLICWDVDRDAALRRLRAALARLPGGRVRHQPAVPVGGLRASCLRAGASRARAAGHRSHRPLQSGAAARGAARVQPDPGARRAGGAACASTTRRRPRRALRRIRGRPGTLATAGASTRTIITPSRSRTASARWR